MTVKLKIETLILMVCICGGISAQNTARPSHTISIDGGYTVPNSNQYGYIEAFDIGIGYNVDWRKGGPQYWKRFWKQPTVGLRLEYLHTNNPIAGQRFGVAANLHNSFWSSPRSANTTAHDIYWFTNAGLSVYTNPFERTENEQNDFIGSYINCLFNLGIGYDLILPNNSALVLNARFSHSSNGYVKKPNRGLNYLLFSVGYRMPQKIRYQDTVSTNSGYDIGDNIARRVVTSEFSTRTQSFMSHRLWLSFAPAIVQSRWYRAVEFELKQKYYFAYTAQAGYMFYPTATLGFGVNLDVMYNYSHIEIVSIGYHVKPKLPYVGGAISFEPRWGAFSIRLSAGYYIVKSPAIEIPVYERLGLFYHFGKSLSQFAGVTIKAHAAHADYIEWHYGVELFTQQPKRKKITTDDF